MDRPPGSPLIDMPHLYNKLSNEQGDTVKTLAIWGVSCESMTAFRHDMYRVVYRFIRIDDERIGIGHFTRRIECDTEKCYSDRW